MRITEPVTTITDYILAAESVFLAVLLIRASLNQHQHSILLWAVAFLALATAALTGGTFHGFQQQLSPDLKTALWKITIYAIGLATFAMLSAVAVATFSRKARILLMTAAALQLAFYIVWMWSRNDFKYVIFNYAPAMLLILAIEIYLMGKGIWPGAVWIAGGIILSFIGAAVQQSGIVLHRHFNFNDIYHIIQMGAMYLLYRGGLLMRDSP